LEASTENAIEQLEMLNEEMEMEDVGANVEEILKDKLMLDMSWLAASTPYLAQSAQSLFDEYTDLYGTDLSNFQDFLDKKVAANEKAYQAYLRHAQEALRLEQQLLQEQKELMLNGLEDVMDISGSLFDRRIMRLDEAIEKNNEYYDNLMDNEELSEEQRTALEEEREAKNEKPQQLRN